MKKAILLTLIIGLSVVAKAQLPVQIVNDPLNYAQLAEGIVQAEEQIRIATEAVTFAKKAQEAAEKVSQAVKTTQMAINVVETGERAISTVRRLYTTMQNAELSASYLSMCSRRCSYATTQIIGCLRVIETVLGTGFKMSDGERMTLLQENLKEIVATTRSIAQLESKTQQLVRKKQIFKSF